MNTVWMGMQEENLFTTKISDGRVTVPLNIRKRHDIVDGDDVTLEFIKKV